MPLNKTPTGRKIATHVPGAPNNVFQADKKNGRKAGAQIPSPAAGSKHESIASEDSLYGNFQVNNCPCCKSDSESWKLSCSKCDQTWHSSCCNLKGITKAGVLALDGWFCPWCFQPPFSHHNRNSDTILDVTNNSTSFCVLNNQFEKLSDFVTSSIRTIETKFVSSFNDNLVKLSTKIDQLSSKIEQQPIVSESPVMCDQPAIPVAVLTHDQTHIDVVEEGFVDTDCSKKLIDHFNSCEFTSEGGHSVILLGEKYRYHGSNVQPSELPDIVQTLIDHVNEKFELSDNKKLNSCLVNKFDGPNSYLSEHSDDEPDIHPESSIFTISLGSPRMIKFREISTGAIIEHTATNGSMYTMTRASQEYYKHQICLDDQFDGVRYSITLRAVHWSNRNSTCIIGDSNTKHLKFGTESGSSFGRALPGKRVFAPTIDDIKPQDCAAYRNVVVMCGINNIKHESVRKQSDIRVIYESFKSKVESICLHNRRAKILICPILPTKCPQLNMKATYFNHLIFSDSVRTNYRASVVHGFDSFVGPDCLLSRDLSVPHVNDMLHLNFSGVKYLASCVKTSIFQRVKVGKKVYSNRTYSDAAGQGLRPPAVMA